MKIFLFLFFCILYIILTYDSYIITDINQFINSINEINFNDAQNIIESVETIMYEYPFINILKAPPLINGKKYFGSVDILKNLDSLKNEIMEKTSMNFYEFHQKLYKIIKQTNDSHITFFYEGENKQLSEYFVISPIVIKTINDQKKLYLSANYLIEYYDLKKYISNYDKIKKKENISIISINDKEPFEYIRSFCKDYITFKNINAKFTETKTYLNYFVLDACPMDVNEFNLKIKYYDKEIIETNFIIVNYEFFNQYNYKKNNEYLKEFFEKENKQKGIITNHKLLKKYLKPNSNKTRNLDEETINWDIDITEFKCRVDNKNKVNVYYQNSFSIENDNIDEIFLYCQKKFLDNNYPIIVIEDYNIGGKVLLSMIFSEIVQNLYNNQLKCSIKIGNYTKQIIEQDGSFFEYLKDNGEFYENNDEFLQDITIDKLSNNNYNKRLKQRPFYVHFAQSYKDSIIRNKYKKPTEIIIFTDGFSYSATSLFIKSLYHFGGAIIVGYNGDPDSDKNDFDASQSPTYVLNLTQTKIPAYDTLKKYGYQFSQISYGPSYKNQYIEGNTNIDYPEEFQVTPVDERIDIYDSYDDNLYQKFIDKAKEIFKKYNEDNKCNPNNKNLKMLNKECDKNFNNYTYGGYECGIDGKWSKICKPFYCHKDYYFDYVNQKCVKDVIAEKFNNINNSDSESKENKESEESEESEDDINIKINKNLMIAIIVIASIIILIIVFACCCRRK